MRTKNKHHLYEKGGILVFLLGIAIAVGITVAAEFFGTGRCGARRCSRRSRSAGSCSPSGAAASWACIETVESITGMASYLRIMAVGLAGAIFADAVNKIAAELGNVVLAIIVGVLLHALNFVIAAFSPTIHAVRLNFLEFFGKFYETGSKEYSPFHKTGGERQA